MMRLAGGAVSGLVGRSSVVEENGRAVTGGGPVADFNYGITVLGACFAAGHRFVYACAIQPTSCSTQAWDRPTPYDLPSIHLRLFKTSKALWKIMLKRCDCFNVVARDTREEALDGRHSRLDLGRSSKCSVPGSTHLAVHKALPIPRRTRL
jgi:hypothetical protein